jgi:hypothetical protein
VVENQGPGLQLFLMIRPLTPAWYQVLQRPALQRESLQKWAVYQISALAMIITSINNGSQIRSGRFFGSESSVIRPPQRACSHTGTRPRQINALHAVSAPSATTSNSLVKRRCRHIKTAMNDRKQPRTRRSISFAVILRKEALNTACTLQSNSAEDLSVPEGP